MQSALLFGTVLIKVMNWQLLGPAEARPGHRAVLLQDDSTDLQSGSSFSFLRLGGDHLSHAGNLRISVWRSIDMNLTHPWSFCPLPWSGVSRIGRSQNQQLEVHSHLTRHTSCTAQFWGGSRFGVEHYFLWGGGLRKGPISISPVSLAHRFLSSSCWPGVQNAIQMMGP